MTRAAHDATLQELARDLPADELAVAAARDFMRACMTPIAETEVLPLRAARGHVLAADVMSPIDVPAHDNSAMDGFAFDGKQLGAGTLRLALIGQALAGRGFDGTVPADACVRIMTGAVMPGGCDTVIPQEAVAAIGTDEITIDADSIRPGANRRRRGEDLAHGSIALAAGKRLGAADLGLLASLGIANVPVRRRLRAAYFSTGDELRTPGEALAPGCIYDSNRTTLTCLLDELGCETIDLGRVPDQPAALDATLREAARRADVVISSGGAAAGDADHTARVMADLGEMLSWRLAMRPGRPFSFGRIRGGETSSWLFGLPGNPVAAMISFLFLVRPALQALAGETTTREVLVPARAAAPIRKRPGRTEYQRGIAERDASGELIVRVTGAQGSGILRSMSEANCLIVLDATHASVAAGEAVDIVLMPTLI